METTIKHFDYHNYVEVWKVTQYKNGRIYRTQNTNTVAHKDTKLPPDHIAVPFSTHKLKQPKLVVTLFN